LPLSGADHVCAPFLRAVITTPNSSNTS
jgi:hypothetical protein